MPISSEPTSSFLTVSSLQSVHSWHLPLFFFFTIKYSHSSAFESQPSTSDGDWLPHYIKLWINSFCLFSFGWWWFSHYVVSSSCDPMDCRPPGSCIHGISQAKILQWVAIAFSRAVSWPRIEPQSPALQADSLSWATREASHLVGLHLFPNNEVLTDLCLLARYFWLVLLYNYSFVTDLHIFQWVPIVLGIELKCLSWSHKSTISNLTISPSKTSCWFHNTLNAFISPIVWTIWFHFLQWDFLLYPPV